MRFKALFWAGILVVGALSGRVAAQTFSFAQVQSAICPRTCPTDAELTGTISYTSGSTRDSGLVTLRVRKTGQSRVDMNLSADNISELRRNGADPQFQEYRDHAWSDRALHNTWTDDSWFFPATAGLVLGANGAFNLTQVQCDGNYICVHQTWQIANQPPKTTAEIAGLSAIDWKLDPNSLLPVTAFFLTHPDEDMNTGILVQVQFSDYRKVSGVMAPFRIQRYVNGTLQVDISVTAAVINPGLPDTDFIAQ